MHEDSKNNIADKPVLTICEVFTISGDQEFTSVCVINLDVIVRKLKGYKHHFCTLKFYVLCNT